MHLKWDCSRATINLFAGCIWHASHSLSIPVVKGSTLFHPISLQKKIPISLNFLLQKLQTLFSLFWTNWVMCSLECHSRYCVIIKIITLWYYMSWQYLRKCTMTDLILFSTAHIEQLKDPTMITLAVCIWTLILLWSDDVCFTISFKNITAGIGIIIFFRVYHCSFRFFFSTLTFFICALSFICNFTLVSSVHASNCCSVIRLFDFLKKGIVKILFVTGLVFPSAFSSH